MASIYKTFSQVSGKWKVVPQGSDGGQPFCFVPGVDSIKRISEDFGIPLDLLEAEFDVKVEIAPDSQPEPVKEEPKAEEKPKAHKAHKKHKKGK